MPTAVKGKKSSPKKTPEKLKSSKLEINPEVSSPIESEDKQTENPALKELFLDSVKDIFWAENHLVKALPKMQKAASSDALAQAIGDHIVVTKTHVSRLEQIFQLLGEKIQAKKCDAMEGLSKEGEGIIEDTEAGTSTRDVGIILASQKVEHYEIATYGGLSKLATILGLTEVADLLSQTLAEEKEADATLSNIAENNINYNASTEA